MGWVPEGYEEQGELYSADGEVIPPSESLEPGSDYTWRINVGTQLAGHSVGLLIVDTGLPSSVTALTVPEILDANLANGESATVTDAGDATFNFTWKPPADLTSDGVRLAALAINVLGGLPVKLR